MKHKTLEGLTLDLACIQISKKCSNCPVPDKVCFDKAPTDCQVLILAHLKKMARAALRKISKEKK